jgi:hypothetical protein
MDLILPAPKRRTQDIESRLPKLAFQAEAPPTHQLYTGLVRLSTTTPPAKDYSLESEIVFRSQICWRFG